MNGVFKYSCWCIFFIFSFICVVLPFVGIGNGAPIVNQSIGNNLFLLFALALLGLIFSVFILFSDRFSFLIKIFRIDLLLILLVCFILINSLFVQDHLAVSYRLYDLGALLLFYLAVRLVDKRGLIILFTFFVVGALLQVVYGELQLYRFYPSLNTNFPITGSFFNSGPYSGYLSAVFPIALGLYLFFDKYPVIATSPFKGLIKYTSLITLLGVILVLSVTMSRAAWVALIFSGSLLLFFRYHWNIRFLEVFNSRIKRAIGISLGLVIVAVVGLGLYHLKKNSADGRTLIWKASWEMIQEKPWLGLGFDRFQASYMESQASWFRNNPYDPAASLADDVVYAFNDGIQLLVEQGIVGFFIIFLLLFAAFKVRGTWDNPEIWLAQAGLVSILIFGMFSYPSHILPIKICGVFYLAVLAGRSPVLVEWRFLKYQRTIKGAMALLACFVGLGTFMVSSKLFSAAKNWNYAYTLYQGGTFGPAVEVYELALPMFDRNGEFLTNYGKALSMTGRHREAVHVLEKAKNYLGNSIIQTTLGDSYKALGMYGQVESAYQLAADMLPDRFYPRYLLVKLYASMGAWDNMEPLAKDLLDKEPKIASRAVEEIKSEVQALLDGIPGRWMKFEPENSLSP